MDVITYPSVSKKSKYLALFGLDHRMLWYIFAAMDLNVFLSKNSKIWFILENDEICTLSLIYLWMLVHIYLRF